MTVSTPALREHRARVTLRWRDMDYLGHLSQSVYHELLDEGRGGLIEDISRQLGKAEGEGLDCYVTVHVDLDYHGEVRRTDGEVEIVARLIGIGESSLRMQHEVRVPDGRLAASGSAVMVAWDPVARTKRVLSDAERALLAA